MHRPMFYPLSFKLFFWQRFSKQLIVVCQSKSIEQVTGFSTTIVRFLCRVIFDSLLLKPLFYAGFRVCRYEHSHHKQMSQWNNCDIRKPRFYRGFSCFMSFGNSAFFLSKPSHGFFFDNRMHPRLMIFLEESPKDAWLHHAIISCLFKVYC